MGNLVTAEQTHLRGTTSQLGCLAVERSGAFCHGLPTRERIPMHPFKEAIRAETRRQFFGRTARGIGGLALANLLADDAFALPGQAPAAVGGLPSLPHFAPKAKRCIYLHMMGRAAADGPARLQAEDARLVRQGPARVDSPGTAVDDDDVGAVALPHRPLGVRVLAAWAGRRVVLRAAAPHREHGRRPRGHPVDAHRRDQPRAGHHLHPDRPADFRAGRASGPGSPTASAA